MYVKLKFLYWIFASLRLFRIHIIKISYLCEMIVSFTVSLSSIVILTNRIWNDNKYRFKYQGRHDTNSMSRRMTLTHNLLSGIQRNSSNDSWYYRSNFYNVLQKLFKITDLRHVSNCENEFIHYFHQKTYIFKLISVIMIL